ncbi:hypothetical protein AAZX31_06G045400 [Glycine max]
MPQARILLTRLINSIVLTSSLSFRDHESRHHAVPRSLLPVQELRFSLRFVAGPSSFIVSNHPCFSLAPASQSPPQNPPLLQPKGPSSLSLKMNHLFPVSLVPNPNNLCWIRFQI